jgi:peroxiredoxin
LEQLRQEYGKFFQLNSEIVVIAPDTKDNAQDFLSRNPMPFITLVDDSLAVYQEFDVQSKLISLGQRPGLFIIDKTGVVQFAYVGAQQWEIPSNQLVLEKLQELERI